ncbi:MAG: ABC transporter ATP-binding protein [Trueperella sp.]|nr:ABC transporter ATP-binding protein [Trueperella sp.]
MRLPLAPVRVILRNSGELLLRYRFQFALVVLLQLLVAGAMAVTPWVIGAAFDAIATEHQERVPTLIAIMIGSVVVQSGLAWLADYRARTLGQYVFDDLRIDLVKTLVNLPLATVESAGTGDLISRTTSDVKRVEFVVQVGISRVLLLVARILIIFVAALAVSPQIGVVLLLALIPAGLMIRWYLRRAVSAYVASSALYAEISGEATETIEQSATVDAFALADHRNRRLSVLLAELWENERYTAVVRIIFSAAQVMILFSPMVLSVLWGAHLAAAGIVTVGTVVSVALYAQQLRAPLDELGWWIDELQFAAVALSRIFGVGMVPPDRPASGDIPVDDAVSVREVSFSYLPDEPVLRDVSLDISSGEHLAIVGPSGAGKSTLGRLLAGINPPDAGEMTIGQVPVTEVDPQVLRSHIALVTQENHVFTGTLAENLRFAAPAATDAELWEALAVVDATAWVRRLDAGLETKVGAAGIALDPAQVQQLALARMVLLDPKVIILDEATSLLDPTAARTAERSLAQVLSGRTVISIAHRLYTAYDADRVAVMIDGEIRELGSHHELLAHNGEYAALWEAWQAQ